MNTPVSHTVRASSARPWVRPLLRWAGSKRSLLPVMLAHVPTRHSGRYIEPFAGSACLFFALRPAQAVLADINSELMATYDAVRRHPRRIARQTTAWPSDSESYYDIRALDPESLKPHERAARFIYLNRLCFNGVYRTNRAGHFNVPYGSRPGALPTAQHMYRCSIALRAAELQGGDFEHALDLARPGDFVYLDPPYSRSASDAYGMYGYGTFQADQDLPRMIDCLKQLDRRGIQFMFSYTSTPQLETLAKRWRVLRIDLATQVGGALKSRSNRAELLIMNYQDEAHPERDAARVARR